MEQINNLYKEFDENIANLIVKSSTGLAFGIAASFLVFKRRSWPVALAFGFGSGLGYRDFQKSFDLARKV